MPVPVYHTPDPVYQIRDADTALGQLIARVSFNYPGSSGKILSVRSSLSHLKHFIDHFEIEEGLKGRKEYGKLVHQYNDTGIILMKFECKVESDSRNPSIRQIETMIAKPVLEGSALAASSSTLTRSCTTCNSVLSIAT